VAHAEITIHPSVLLAWSLANRHAMLSGSSRIEPAHFVLATLEIIDGVADPGIAEMDPGQISDIKRAAEECRESLGLTPEEVTRTRRSLRKVLDETDRELEPGLLHRSQSSRKAFNRAARSVLDSGGQELTLAPLARSLLQEISEPGARMGAGGHLMEELERCWPAGKVPMPAAQGEGVGRSPGSALARLSRDLSQLAREGRLTQVVGRETEMTTIARHLMRTSKRNVVVVGDAGVGKTAVVEGLAQRLAHENAPEALRSLRILQISVSDLVAGTRYRGDMEERLQELLREVEKDPNVVLFLDEVHLVMKAGSADTPMDIANILKPALAGGSFRCIGATTTEEFERYLKDDSAFLRRFQVVRLNEPSPAEAVRICQAWVDRIERAQNVSFSQDAVETAVDLSVKHLPARRLPDKAIDLLENAATRVLISSLSFDRPADVRPPLVVTSETLREVIEEQTGIADSDESRDELKKLAEFLREQVVGQDEAIGEVVETLARTQLRAEGAAHPRAVMMFIGPTGVGKTYLAECLAKGWGGPKGIPLCRLSMNEYKEHYDIARLVGAAPGLIGHDRQGVLFRFVEGSPQGVILLDEIEKAHPEVIDYFLEIFDRAEAVDSRGRRGDFRPCIFVLTCNAATSDRRSGIGFIGAGEGGSAAQGRSSAELSGLFRPEFLARIDQVVEFSELDREDYAQIVGQRLVELASTLERGHKVRFDADPAVVELLTEAGLAQTEGARGMLRLFEQLLVAPVVEEIGAGTTVTEVIANVEGGKVKVVARGEA